MSNVYAHRKQKKKPKLIRGFQRNIVNGSSNNTHSITQRKEMDCSNHKTTINRADSRQEGREREYEREMNERATWTKDGDA